MKRGFTLLELIIVIVIIGILASLGFSQYTRMIEKGRTAEAKMILGQIRLAQEAYKLEHGNYAATFDNLPILLPPNPLECAQTRYFKYRITASAATATRCESNGKLPNSTIGPYTIILNYASGDWSGSDAGLF